MDTAITALIIFIAAFHVWALVLEMFLWTKPLGRKTFGISKADAETSKSLAMNQGLYNGFLVVGLIASLVVSNPDTAHTLKLLFLSFVAAAGIFGGLTVNFRIFVLQAVPALIALALILTG